MNLFFSNLIKINKKSKKNTSKSYKNYSKLYKIKDYNSYKDLAKIFPIKWSTVSNYPKKQLNKKAIFNKVEKIKNKINKYKDEIIKNKTQIVLAKRQKLLLNKTYKIVKINKNPDLKSDKSNLKINDDIKIKDETEILLYKSKIKSMEKNINNINNKLINLKFSKNLKFSSKFQKIDKLRNTISDWKLKIYMDYLKLDPNFQNSLKIIIKKKELKSNNIIFNLKNKLKELKASIFLKNNDYIDKINNYKYVCNNKYNINNKILNKKEIIINLKNSSLIYCKRLNINIESFNNLENELNVNKIRERYVENQIIDWELLNTKKIKKFKIKLYYNDFLVNKLNNLKREFKLLVNENQLEIDRLIYQVNNKKIEISNKKSPSKYDWQFFKYKSFKSYNSIKNFSLLGSQLNINHNENYSINEENTEDIPLLKIVLFNEIKDIINKLRLSFMNDGISLDFIISCFNPIRFERENDLCIRNIIHILEQYPFDLEEEESLMISRYIVEDNSKEKVLFNLNNSIDVNILRSIIKSMFNNYKIYTKKEKVLIIDKIKSIWIPSKKRIKSTFYNLMNIKNDLISTDDLKNNFIINDIVLNNEYFNFIILILYNKSNNIKNFSIKEFFLFLENK